MQAQGEQSDQSIAQRWCASRGPDWSVVGPSGSGATATVFLLNSPQGAVALKLYNRKFSNDEKPEIQERRLEDQKRLGAHDCPYIIKIYEVGRFEDRFFVLMEKASGRELEKCLAAVPRAKIRLIVDQIARACIFLRGKGLCHRDVKAANIFVSDDFESVKLLDVSVMRDIHDPIGIGTDHGGQLPVVATARYSPWPAPGFVDTRLS